MSGWTYDMFTTSDFNGFNAKLKHALDSIVHQGLVPSVSYSHAITSAGVSYSAIILGLPPTGGTAAPPQD